MPPKISPENVQEGITIDEIRSQILSNAEILFQHNRDLKVISGQSQNGLNHYTSIVANDAKPGSSHKDYKIVMSGGGGSNRRASMMALLVDTEKKIAKTIMKK